MKLKDNSWRGPRTSALWSKTACVLQFLFSTDALTRSCIFLVKKKNEFCKRGDTKRGRNNGALIMWTVSFQRHGLCNCSDNVGSRGAIHAGDDQKMTKVMLRGCEHCCRSKNHLNTICINFGFF